jgi:hypothetical protein
MKFSKQRKTSEVSKTSEVWEKLGFNESNEKPLRFPKPQRFGGN